MISHYSTHSPIGTIVHSCGTEDDSTEARDTLTFHLETSATFERDVSKKRGKLRKHVSPQIRRGSH